MAERKSGKLYEEIAAKMLEQVHTGELRSGDRLPSERTLAESYGVSRTVIREALRSLEMMGCVESRVGEGTFIREPSLSDIVDPFSLLIAGGGSLGGELIEVRLILETEIAALAAKRRTDAQIEAMQSTLDAMRTDIERGGRGITADADFHRLLAESAHNDAIRVILEMCDGMLSRTRPLTQSIKGVPRMTLEDHSQIFEAVKNGDERAARRLMRRHLNRALRNLSRFSRNI